MEMYWQVQLFTLLHGISSIWDWYSTLIEKVIGKRKSKIISILNVIDSVLVL